MEHRRQPDPQSSQMVKHRLSNNVGGVKRFSISCAAAG
jgi:hypothetical protein